jgi:glycosyltransferase involved in cell wall biosynthesis
VEAQPGEHLLVADDEDEIVDALVELLLDPTRRRRLAENARAWAEASLGWDEGVAAFEKLYDNVAGARRRCG